MTLIAKLGGRLAREEDGAALVEYTVLLGILVVAVIASIALIGTWVSGQWDTLKTDLCAQDDTAAGCT
ncbi:hypothetical protein ATER59S_00988 [Aquamicrobium terrae]